MKKICINCNEENLQEALFCKKCGTKLPSMKEIQESAKEDKEAAEEKFRESIKKTREAQDPSLEKDNVMLIGDGKEKVIKKPIQPEKRRTRAEIRAEKEAAIRAEKASQLAMIGVSKAPKDVMSNKTRAVPRDFEKKKKSNTLLWIAIVVVIVGAAIFSLRFFPDLEAKLFGFKDQLTQKATDISAELNKKNDLSNQKLNTTGLFADPDTKLMWQDNKASKTEVRDWHEAKSYCEDLSLGGHNDWRLPLRSELESIAETDNTPAIIRGFSFTDPAHYWASPRNSSTSLAWYVYFGEGGGTYYGEMSELQHTRCVRN